MITWNTKVDSPLVADLVVQQWQRERNAPPASQPSVSATNDLDARQQAAAERWAARQQNAPQPMHSQDGEPKRNQTLHRENENERGRTYPHA
jgi:hypothetical protein